MPSLAALLAELVGSLLRLAEIFVTEVAVRDPLAFVAFGVGGLLTTAAVGFFGYLAAGAALDAVEGVIRSFGGTRRRRG